MSVTTNMPVFDDELSDNKNWSYGDGYGDGDYYGDGWGRGSGEDPETEIYDSWVYAHHTGIKDGNGKSFRFDETLNEYV